MNTVTKPITSLYHVFGEQAKFAVITGVNESEGYYLCDLKNGVGKLLDCERHIPFSQIPFDPLTDDERGALGMAPIPEVEPEAAPPPAAKPKPEPKAKPATKKTPSKGTARKTRGK